MSLEDQARSKRPRKAAGPERHTYFNDTDVDRIMAIVLALVSEVASIRDRLDSHERIVSGGESPSVEGVEAYRPDPATEESREAWRDAYIRRLFRVITEDVEALRPGSKTDTE